jgi:predicted enzyme related to lactoylglutathione lyase
MQQVNVVNWFEIYVDDMPRARKFYEAVLGKAMTDMQAPNDGNLIMVAFPWAEGDAPNASGALVQMEQVKAGGNSTLVYFTCDDCATEQSRVEAAGGKIMQPKFAIGDYGFCAICMDTEGNCFGLHSVK